MKDYYKLFSKVSNSKLIYNIIPGVQAVVISCQLPKCMPEQSRAGDKRGYSDVCLEQRPWNSPYHTSLFEQAEVYRAECHPMRGIQNYEMHITNKITLI